MAVIYFVLFAS